MIDRVQQALRRLRAFFDKQTLDHELNAEIAAHLEIAIEENVQRGLSPEEARLRALLSFGGLEQAKERHRETRGLPVVDVLGQDFCYAFRTLRRDRVFSIIAVLILGLAIGTNVAVFSVIHTILLRPLPFQDPQRLVWIEGPSREGGLSSVTYSVDAFEEYQQRNHSLAGVTAYMPFYGPSDFKLTGRGEPQPVSGVMVECNFFQTLGVHPMLGRPFTPEECRKNAAPAVLLSYFFWKRQLAGDGSIVGQAITLNETGHANAAVTVAGLLPPTFDFGSVFAPGTKMDILLPATYDMRNWAIRSCSSAV